LPLHVACLYRASSAVLSVLLQAHPEAANEVILGGMLPIHIVSNTSIDIPPPIRPPTDFECLTVEPPSTLADSLVLLSTIYPESLHMACANGQTPLDYIQSTMKEGMEKTACLNILLQDNDDMQDVESIL
jgi:hypothetical protein